MTKQINLKIPEHMFNAFEKYVQSFGFRNVQELALESMREKVFESGEYDEDFSEKEIELIDKIIAQTLKSKDWVSEKKLREALR